MPIYDIAYTAYTLTTTFLFIVRYLHIFAAYLLEYISIFVI